jgi:spermidine/putrescine transport system permease protein
MTVAAEGQATPRIGRAAQKSLLQSEAAQGWVLISPTFLFALVLLVAPILVVIAHSFWTQNYLTIDRTFTLENYRVALTEPIYRDLLLRSLYVSLLVSVFTVVLAYPIAYFLPWRASQGPVAVPDHHTVLDQLPAARDVMEGHPRL